MTEKSGAFMKKWSNRSKQKGRGWSARYLISLGWSQTFSGQKQKWWLIWPRNSSYRAGCCMHSCVSLPLQEALRHDRSNLLQKELRSKEQELEKILYRQKKVTGPKSLLKKHVPFYCLSAEAFSDWEWFFICWGLVLVNLVAASLVLSCLWRCWSGLSSNWFVFNCNVFQWMFWPCIFLSALFSLGTILLSVVQ